MDIENFNYHINEVHMELKNLKNQLDHLSTIMIDHRNAIRKIIDATNIDHWNVGD